MTPSVNVSEVLALRDKLLDTLSKVQEQRNANRDWMAHELNVMTAVVNEERSKRGLPRLAREDVVKAETLALGHTDYSRKFSLYCAELVLYGQTGF